MPIRPENRDRYPANWPDISRRIRTERAGGWCECRGECGLHGHNADWSRNRCPALNGKPHPITGSTVVLTVAHLNHTPEDCRDENLLAMCNRCHLNYDKDHHRETRLRTIAEAKRAAGQLSILDGADLAF